MSSRKAIFKNIFAKYFAIVAALIAISFMLTAAVQAVFARRYWIEDKRRLLNEQVHNVAAMMKENMAEFYPDNYYVSEEVRPLLIRMAEASDTNVLITDTDYRILMCSHQKCSHHEKVLPEAIRDGLQQQDFFAVTMMGDLYDTSQYTTGTKLKVGGDTVVGYVVVSSSAEALGAYILDNLQVYSLSAVAVLMLAFIALYIMTYQMVRPLRQMAALTRQFSNGD
ncbi:MAG: hypothetical protein IJC52_00725, partial [Clostridia bacterium]|nr:hypothetical protein [Clostridia bacterium]